MLIFLIQVRPRLFLSSPSPDSPERIGTSSSDHTLDGCLQLVFGWPASNTNVSGLLKVEHSTAAFQLLVNELEGGILALISQDGAVFMPAGVIHATATLQGGILIGVNTISVNNFFGVMTGLAYELRTSFNDLDAINHRGIASAAKIVHDRHPENLFSASKTPIPSFRDATKRSFAFDGQPYEQHDAEKELVLLTIKQDQMRFLKCNRGQHRFLAFHHYEQDCRDDSALHSSRAETSTFNN